MKIRRFLEFLLVLNVSFVLAACASKDDKPSESESETEKESEVAPVSYVDRELSLINLSEGYTLTNDKINMTFKEGGTVPYIGVKEYMNKLEGFYDSSEVVVTMNGDVCHLEYTLEEEGEEPEQVYMDIDTKKDEIKTNTAYFFSFTKENESISYDRHTQTGDPVVVFEEENDLVYDLAHYEFDSFMRGDDCLLPLSVLNVMVTATNLSKLLYNQKDVYFFDTYLEDDIYFATVNKKLRNKDIPADLIHERNNQIFFALDYYYGLKEVKEITDYKAYVEGKPEIMEYLNDPTPVFPRQAYSDLFMKDFDDPHTALGYKNYFSEVKSPEKGSMGLTLADLGPRYTKIVNDNNDLYQKYQKAFGELKEGEMPQILRFSGETAFIKFEQFTVGSNEEVYDAQNNVKEDAWKYDTFYLFKKAFTEIATHPEVTNVVIDLSTNGGGVLGACFEVLGFLTNEDIRTPSSDMSAKFGYYQSVKVDVDEDGDYTDNDAYDYNYYILTSSCTFSAANYFTAVCHDMGIAEIIGVQSGGGMCGVMEVPLIDGSTYTMSGSFCLNGWKANEAGEVELYPIEYGIPVDHELGYDSFYNLDYLNSYVSKLAKK